MVQKAREKEHALGITCQAKKIKTTKIKKQEQMCITEKKMKNKRYSGGEN